MRKGELGEVYHTGGMNEWNNIDICRLICSLMGEHKSGHALHENAIILATGRPVYDWHYAIDAMKMNTKSGGKPVETFKTGIRKTMEWSLHAIK